MLPMAMRMTYWPLSAVCERKVLPLCVYFFQQRFVQLVAAAQAEADHGEGNWRDALEAFVGIDPSGKLARQLHCGGGGIRITPSRPK